MRILCINRKYDGVVGGVEKMSISLMNNMISAGHVCGILSLDQQDAVSFYEMDTNLSWFKIGIGNSEVRADFFTKVKRFIKIRKSIKRFNPDVIIGFQDGAFLLGLFGSFGLGIPVVAAERNALERFDYLSNGGKRKQKICNLYRFASAITVQCPSYPESYPKFLRKKIHVIGNPVFLEHDVSPPPPTPQKGTKQKTVLAVGRFCYQKNFLILLEAFAILFPQYPDWKLIIIGGGENKSDLEAYINSNGLSNAVELKHFTENVGPYYQNSDIFCIPSLWEGFPNVLAEAQSYGLPAVGFKSCAGVRDLIQHEKNGILSDERSSSGLSSALQILMDDADKRENFGLYASKTIKAYNSDVIFDQWNDFFTSFRNTKE